MKIKYKVFLILLFIFSNMENLFAQEVEKQGIKLMQLKKIIERYKLILLENTKVDAGQIKSFLSNMREDGTWADVNYLDDSPNGFTVIDHLGRIEKMAIAFALPSNSLFNNADLQFKIQLGINHWALKKYQSKNWWFNEIGTPIKMRRIQGTVPC